MCCARLFLSKASPLQHPKAKAKAAAAEANAQMPFDAPAEPWTGCRGNVAARDGVVFSGVGGMSRASLRDVAHWTETFLFDEFYAQWTPLVHVA